METWNLWNHLTQGPPNYILRYLKIGHLISHGFWVTNTDEESWWGHWSLAHFFLLPTCLFHSVTGHLFKYTWTSDGTAPPQRNSTEILPISPAGSVVHSSLLTDLSFPDLLPWFSASQSLVLLLPLSAVPSHLHLLQEPSAPQTQLSAVSALGILELRASSSLLFPGVGFCVINSVSGSVLHDGKSGSLSQNLSHDV